MKLEIKHLAPYLPYGLKGTFRVGDALPHLVSVADEVRQKELNVSNVEFFLLHCKPLHRPLSDLTKEIEHNGERFVPIEKLKCLHPMIWFNGDRFVAGIRGLNIDEIPLNVANSLFEWHFDVFGLIDSGVAIDLNTIQK
jgi:hypothetical protein